MKRSEYYPTRLEARPEWHTNFAAKLQLYGPALGLTTAQVDAGVADNLYLAYGLGDWIKNVRDFAPACTKSLDDLCFGTGGDPYVFTAYTAPTLPTLPAGITVVLPGALARTFKLVQEIKNKVAYTDAIGTDMGVLGAEITTDHPTPTFTLKSEMGGTCHCVIISHRKYGHAANIIESRRGTGDWEQLAISATSPFEDERPLLVAGVPEVREYRLRFWDDGQGNGDWTPVQKITVSP